MHRRTFVSLLTSATVLAPSVAFGLLMSPSAVLETIQMNTNPQRFTAEAYVQVPSESMELTIRANGAYEGTTAQTLKGKMDVTIALNSPLDSAFISVKAVVRGHMLYIQLADVVSETPVTPSNIVGQWFSVDLQEEYAQQEAGMEMWLSDDDITEEDMRSLVRTVQDAIFQMESTLVNGGASYKLTFKENFLFSLAESLCDSGVVDCTGGGDFGSLAEMRGELAELQRELDGKVNLSYKVDTDRAGYLQFARMYFSLTWPEEVIASFQGETHTQTTPIYVEIPADAQPLEELMEQNGFFWSVEPDWETEDEWTDWEDAEDWSDIEWEEIDWSDDEWDTSTWDEVNWSDCDAEPGSAAYLQKARKGECALPEDIRPGRGNRRDLR